jgi:hypothetical protein
MKKIWIVSIVAICCLAMAMATISGWRLITATSHLNVTEGVEIQYLENGDWVNLAVDGSNIQFGSRTLRAGETDTLYLRARNNANSGILGLTVSMDNAQWLYHGIRCYEESSGTLYTAVDNTVYMKLPANESWKALAFDTTADGEIPTGEITFDNTAARGNALEEYVSACN